MSIAARRSHRGDEYQLAVAVHWLIRLLSDSEIVSVQVDAVSLPASSDTVDVDDIVVTYADGNTRHIQAKKNQPNHSSWQISDRDLKEELFKAHQQLDKTPDAIIEFCSQTPFGDLAALVDSMRDYSALEVFEAQASAKLQTALGKLQNVIACSNEAAFNLIRHIEIGSAHNFTGWEAANLSSLHSVVDNPSTSIEVLEKIARRSQSGLGIAPGPVTREMLIEALKERGVGLIGNVIALDSAHIIASFVAASFDLTNWKSTLPNDDWLERPELQLLCEQIADQPSSLTLLLGEPGCGKSALLARLAQEHMALEFPVLAIKADYLSENVFDTPSLGDYLRLPADPVDCVALLAKTSKVIILIDQLDALADLVVQHSTRLRAPMDLIRGLSGLENVHIVASCRVFEHKHDTRLRNLDAETIVLELPSWDKVEETLKKYGIHAAAWNSSIREDLRSPQTLNLFLQLINTTDEAALLLGYQHMLGELWKQQVLSDTSGRSRTALYDITARMAEREVLWLPEALFDTFHVELQRLSRSGILLCEAGRVGFRHQTLYEYIRARSFLEEPGRLTEAVLARQGSLRVRPLLWHSLTYMRAVDRPTYAQEIDRLWRSDLRPHLKMLLIEFLGQLSEPDISEKTLVEQKWGDAWYRNRILATVPGSTGWFDWLADNHLVSIMRLPVDESRAALPVLRRALPARQARVLELVSSHWQSLMGNDPLIWAVLEQLPVWDADAVALCRQILLRTKISAWQAFYMISIVSEASPDEAPQLVDAWLRHEISDAQSLEQEIDRIVAVLNAQEFHDLPSIAEAAPLKFISVVWPWVLKAIEHCSMDAHDFVIGYRSVDSRFPNIDDRYMRREMPFIAAVVAAINAIAMDNPEAFREFLQANRQLEFMPVQRLLAWGLQQLAPHSPSEVLEFLTEDARRLVIGTYHDVHADSNRLIRIVAPYLDDQQIRKLEHAILCWNRYAFLPDSDAKARLHRLQWTREHRLRLLRAIPAERMSPSCRQHLTEEERAFPGLQDADIRSYRLRGIGSPMSAAAMRQASDENVLRLFAELTDQTQWDHPRHPMRGGVIQASRELAALAKEVPDKAIRLTLQMMPGRNGIAVGAVLRALGESKFDALSLYSLVLELNQKGFDDHDFRVCAADAVGSVVKSDTPLPDALFDSLISWLHDDPESQSPEQDKEDAEEKDQAGSILWGYGGIIILPDGNYPVLSALTRACLSLEPPNADKWLSILESHLRREERLKVWGALAHHLRWLNCADHDLAQRFLLNLFRAYPGLCDFKTGVLLIANSQHWISAHTANALLHMLFATRSLFSAQASGEILMLRFVLKDDEQHTLLEELERILTRTREDSFSIRCRIGIAYATAELWTEADFRTKAHPYLLRLLGDHDENVVAAAARIFSERKLKPDAQSREVLAYVAERPNLLRQIANDDLGECLISMLEVTPLLASTVARSILDAVGDDFFNHKSSRYFLAEHLLTVALRLQEMGAPHQELGAHIFERLLEFNTPETRSVVLDLDKRTTNMAGMVVPRRRKSRQH